MSSQPAVQRGMRAGHIVAVICAVLASLSHLLMAMLLPVSEGVRPWDTTRVALLLIVASCAAVSAVVVICRAQWGRTVSLTPAVLSAVVMLGITLLTVMSIGPLWLPGIVGTLCAVAILQRQP